MLLWFKDLMNVTKEVTCGAHMHTCLTNHTIGWDEPKIITTNWRCHQGLCVEAWHINSAHIPLNCNDGGLLPDAYLHLVRKKAAN